jgi:hypothetical protein
MRKWFVRVGDSLIGMDEKAKKSISRLAEGEVVELEMRRARSPAFNRWYWACCAEIGRNQDPVRDEESISDEIKVLAGHYVVVPIVGTDFEVRSPKHINFRAMNAEQWNEYFKKAEIVMMERFGFDPERFRSQW